MSIFITLVAALIVFSAVIAIHEFGHFAVAKLCGIQVNEFSIGMGPALWKKIYKGTQYSLRALPVGGYVALEGEESPESQQAEAARDEREAETASPIPPEQRTGIPLNDAPVWQRALVMAAGAFMNFVLGFVVLVILVAAQEGPITSRVIYSIEGSALCGQTGLQAGDEIVAVNGRRCFVANDILYELVRTEQYRARFTVKRDGQKVELPDVQFDTWQDEDGQTHMSLGFTVYGIPKTPLHVGVTEAGTYQMGLLKSGMGIGGMLLEGIGDTIRVSLAAEPEKEVEAGYNILRAVGFPVAGPEVITCPTCGRTQYPCTQIANEVEKRLQGCKKSIKVAVMGCVVNGPGEAREADIGIAGGKGEAVLFIHGKPIKKLTGDNILDQFMDEIYKL